MTTSVEEAAVLGARPTPGGATTFRVWAPGRSRVEVVWEGQKGAPPLVLTAGEDGLFSGARAGVCAGARYRLRLDGRESFPDPASRFQPQGPHGPSQVVDPDAFRWTDAAWRGLSPRGQVLYELHVGTFTPEGTWRAARERLAALAGLGVTAVSLMPVAEFPGRFGWGYDGVDWFAPYHGYGTPEDFRSFVDGAHAAGLGVLLDVVYNHFGPDGNYLKSFSPDYFSRRQTEWGEALNYDGPNCGGARRLARENAAYWIRDFHLDGLRFDATQSVFDSSRPSILTEAAAAARRAARGRSLLLVAENEPLNLDLLGPAEEGGGFDSIWNDDFHHSAVVALTGRREAYYLDYTGSPQELISACRWGTLFQGQRYAWQDKRRGLPAYGLPAWSFVNYLENHDQLANSHPRGERLAAQGSPGRYRALSALLLLGPQTPMLFQGQERGARSPFPFFADHGPGLREAVRDGRRRFMSQFACLRAPPAREEVPDPADEDCFRRCVVSGESAEVAALYRDLLRLRREDPVFSAQDAARLHGAVLGPAACALRFFGKAGGQRLLLLNLGAQLALSPLPEPLLAPPRGAAWEPLWSSEEPSYGGCGTPVADERRWELPAESVLVYRGGPHAA